jgi:hypothetical protein
MSFLSDIQNFREKALQQASKNASEVFEYVSRQVVLLSPNPPGKRGYAQGHLKNQWYASVDSPSSYTSNSKSDTGQDSLARLQSVLATQPFYGKDATLYFTNSVSYAYRVESFGWPKNDPTNTTSWLWTGRATPYAMKSTAVQMTLLKYKV